ncbi:hypothetical protein [Bacteroides sp.]
MIVFVFAVGYFPASGYRNLSGGGLSFIGNEADNWSSSSLEVGSGYSPYLAFVASWVNTWRSGSRVYGFSVRCVQELINDTFTFNIEY